VRQAPEEARTMSSVTNARKPAFWLLLAPLWLVPIFFAFNDHLSIKMEYGLATIFVYSIFIRLPHFFATYAIFISFSTVTRKMCEHPFKYFFVPLGLFALYTVPLTKLVSVGIEPILVRFAYLWGFLHICTQAYGISLIFLSQRSRWAKPLILTTFLLLFIHSSGLSLIHTLLFGGVTKDHIRWFCRVLIALSTLRLIWEQKQNLQFIFYFVSAIICIFPWPFYDNHFQFFLIYNAHHALNYLAITLYMTASPRSRLTGYSKITLYFGLVCSSVALFLLAPAGVKFYREAHGFILAFFVLHYYFESVIWRDRQLDLKSYLPKVKVNALN
jgi:hypothetical protein